MGFCRKCGCEISYFWGLRNKNSNFNGFFSSENLNFNALFLKKFNAFYESWKIKILRFLNKNSNFSSFFRKFKFWRIFLRFNAFYESWKMKMKFFWRCFFFEKLILKLNYLFLKIEIKYFIKFWIKKWQKKYTVKFSKKPLIFWNFNGKNSNVSKKCTILSAFEFL